MSSGGQNKIALTPEQTSWMIANAHLTYMEQAAHLRIGLRTVHTLRRRLGLLWNSAHRWTKEEDELLASNASTKTAREIALLLKVTRNAVQQRAKRLGVALGFDHHPWSPEEDARLRQLVASGKCVLHISKETGWTRERIWHRLARIKLKAADGRSHRVRTQKPKPPKAEKPPRERIGLPVAIRRTVVTGTVKYCDRCGCPVVDTPERWASHNLIAHATPVFPVTCNSRRIA